MCGIVGYIGGRPAAEIVLAALKRLEYRGYDSAGIAVLNASGIEIRRSAGKLANLEALLRARPLEGRAGLGHTRWATHGRPSEENAHPHLDCSGGIAVVHNGILENYLALREGLVRQGHKFKSETDSEVLAHLVEHHAGSAGSLEAAVQRALGDVRGAYAMAVLADWAPDRIVTAKHGGGGVVLGAGRGEAFIASDIPAILPHTRDVVILDEDEMAVVTRDGYALSTVDGRAVDRGPTRLEWEPSVAGKGGYRHFMLKEIYEQPAATLDTFRGRGAMETGDAVLPECRLDSHVTSRITRVLLAGCGTSYHATLVARTLIERLAGLPAEVDISSELRYRDPLIGDDVLVVAISQSGETADTLGALKVARAKGARTLAVTNVLGSALSREADGVLYTRAGPEIGVCSTKTFTATIVACYLLALHLGRGRRFLSRDAGLKYLHELMDLPAIVRAALGVDHHVESLAGLVSEHSRFMFLGRGLSHPVALEGALKLKEISYLPAEAFPGGEMKHGPIALVDKTMPVVGLIPRDTTYNRMLANLEEIRARDGLIIAVAHPDDREVSAIADHVIAVPPAPELLAPIVNVVPLQLLAYHVALRRGCDVDQPRNLAKSVTVE